MSRAIAVSGTYNSMTKRTHQTHELSGPVEICLQLLKDLRLLAVLGSNLKRFESETELVMGDSVRESINKIK